MFCMKRKNWKYNIIVSPIQDGTPCNIYIAFFIKKVQYRQLSHVRPKQPIILMIGCLFIVKNIEMPKKNVNGRNLFLENEFDKYKKKVLFEKTYYILKQSFFFENLYSGFGSNQGFAPFEDRRNCFFFVCLSFW